MSHERHEPQQMEDELPMGKLLKVAAAALIIGTLGVAWAWGEWRYVLHQSQPNGMPALPQAIGAAEQGVVFQRPFDQLRASADLELRERQQLESFGWADRSRGLVHVPIGMAIDEIVRRHGR
ncbi:MAG TPA: hypothetical protein VGK67_32005 [Myxococcales bacterium]|jgi:hypothetical protein